MYYVECIDIHKTDKMYLYLDRACQCANNMYNVANFHIRNLMTGLKKKGSQCTENEASVISTFASSIPGINSGLRVKLYVKALKIFSDCSLSDETREAKLSRMKCLRFSMPTAEKWFAPYELLDAVFRYTDNTDYRSFHSHVIQNAVSDCCEAWAGYFESLKTYPSSSGHTGKPKIPGYRKSGGRSTAVFSNLACSIKHGKLYFPYASDGSGKKRVRPGLDVSKLPHASKALGRSRERNSSRRALCLTSMLTRSRSLRMTAFRKRISFRMRRTSFVPTGNLPVSCCWIPALTTSQP